MPEINIDLTVIIAGIIAAISAITVASIPVIASKTSKKIVDEEERERREKAYRSELRIMDNEEQRLRDKLQLNFFIHYAKQRTDFSSLEEEIDYFLEYDQRIAPRRAELQLLLDNKE